MTLAVVACGGLAEPFGYVTGTALCVFTRYGFHLVETVGQSVKVTIG